MSFFSDLFYGHDEPEQLNDSEEQALPESQREESSSSPESQLEKGMSLDVSIDGVPFLSGRVSEFSRRLVTLERNTGQLAFAMCDPGTIVTVRGYIRDATPFDFEGVVEESTRIRFRIRNCRTITHNEKRNNFRVFVNIPMSMYYPEDKEFENPEQCTLIDIGSAGACVESEFIHGEGEVLQLKIQIESYAPMTFLSEVIRVKEVRPGIFQYGMLFAQLDERETMSLTRMLFNVQVGNTKAKQRINFGYWS